MITNTQAINNNFTRYVELYDKTFGTNPESFYSYLRWLADSNLGHTFQPNETKLAIELFESL